MKEPLTYFSTVITSLLYYGDYFLFSPKLVIDKISQVQYFTETYVQYVC